MTDAVRRNPPRPNWLSRTPSGYGVPLGATWRQSPKRSSPIVEIDLSKAERHEHPDIDPEKHYLARHRGTWYFGRFHRVWFGWHFACGYGASGGFQFDAPGFNHSGWERLFEIKVDEL